MAAVENGISNGFFEDNPQHEAGDTSSIGGLWPPEDTTHRRIKAFYDRLITMPDELAPFVAAFEESCERLDEAELTRVQFRAVIEADVLRQAADLSLFKHSLEAIIPLDPGHLGKEPLVVYISANSVNRLPDHDDIARILRNLEKAMAVPQKTPQEMLERASQAGYVIDILSLPNEREARERTIDQMFALYERFGWTREQVSEMLHNPANIIAVARKGAEIVSAGIAELAKIPVGNTVLRIAEITEAATLKDHAGNGVYAAVSTKLLLELAALSKANKIFGGELDFTFGECNGLSQVIKVVRSQGRTFSMEVSDRYGFPCRGILRQQVPIGGAERNTEYNDLLPAFLTRSALYASYAPHGGSV